MAYNDKFFIYFQIDGFALIVIAGMALTGAGGDFSGDSDLAFEVLIGAGCVMLLIGTLSCIAVCAGKYNNTCLCIIVS